MMASSSCAVERSLHSPLPLPLPVHRRSFHPQREASPSVGAGPYFHAIPLACRKPHPLTTRHPRGFVLSPHTPGPFLLRPPSTPCAQLGKPPTKLPPFILFSHLLSPHQPAYGNRVPTIHPAFMRIPSSYPLFHPQRLLLLEISILSLSFLEAFSPAQIQPLPKTRGPTTRSLPPCAQHRRTTTRGPLKFTAPLPRTKPLARPKIKATAHREKSPAVHRSGAQGERPTPCPQRPSHPT